MAKLPPIRNDRRKKRSRFKSARQALKHLGGQRVARVLEAQTRLLRDHHPVPVPPNG